MIPVEIVGVTAGALRPLKVKNCRRHVGGDVKMSNLDTVKASQKVRPFEAIGPFLSIVTKKIIFGPMGIVHLHALLVNIDDCKAMVLPNVQEFSSSVVTFILNIMKPTCHRIAIAKICQNRFLR